MQAEGDGWPAGFFELLVAHIDAAVICTDLRGTLLYCNPAAERLYGMTASEAVGRSSSELLGVEVSDDTTAAIARTLGRGEVWEGDFSVARSDGTELTLRTRDAGLYDDTGALTAVVSIAVDVTERRRTAESLLASNARHAAMLESALDAVISMDHNGLIVEFNPAAEAMFGFSRSEVLGRELAEVIVPPSLRAGHRNGLLRYLETGEGNVLGRRVELEAIDRSGREFPVEVAITRIDVPGPAAFMGSLRDISARRAAEQALVDSRAHFARLARTLQASLLPPTLPVVPGFDVAVGFRPAGEGDEVGGDFYDLFETGSGDWAIVIGDVQGKGPEAATVTALVRYTVRAAAMRSSRPSVILRTVNEAILHQRGTRFCTVAYIRLHPPAAGRTLATVGVGGHPLPLLVRPDGSVTTVGNHGTLLGALAETGLTDADVVLEPGDSLVLYTDGVTETRRDGLLFGELRLRKAVALATNASAAEMVRSLEQAVLSFDDGRPRDDMAIVVLRRLPDDG